MENERYANWTAEIRRVFQEGEPIEKILQVTELTQIEVKQLRDDLG